jgi:tetratricopeptide (TPR) repeat protein
VRVSSPKRIGFRLRLSDGPGEKAFFCAATNDWQQVRETLKRISPYKLVRATSYWSLYCSALAVTDAAEYDNAVETTARYYSHATAERTLGFLLEATTLRPSDKLSQDVLEGAVADLDDAKPQWIQRQVGRALLRARRFQDVVEWHKKHTLTGIEAECTLAMAYHYLGQETEASTLLQDIKRRELPALSELKLPLWFTGFVLLREANQQITGQPLDEDPQWQTALAAIQDAVAGTKPETAEYDLALLLQPRDPKLWAKRAKRYADLSRWTDAETDFEQALSLDRKNIHTWLAAARYWSQRGDLEKSTDAYATLLDLDQAGELRDDVLSDFEQQDSLYTALLDRRERDMLLWRARGTSLCKQRRWQDAVPIWNRLLELKPNDWNLLRESAMLHARTGNESHFTRACQAMMDVESPPPLTAWYASMLPAGGVDRGVLLAMAQTFYEDDPTNTAALNTLGAAMLRTEQYAEALETLEFAARLSETDEAADRTPEAYAWFLLAIAHGKLGHQAEAQRWCTKAQLWLEQHAESRMMRTWLRQITVEILAAEARQTLDQVAKVMD